MSIKILWRASKHEIVRAQVERAEIVIDWPSHVPVPQVGDELLFKNSPVTIVDREYSHTGRSVDEGQLDDMQLTLVWRDRRHESGPLIRDNDLGPDEKPKRG